MIWFPQHPQKFAWTGQVGLGMLSRSHCPTHVQRHLFVRPKPRGIEFAASSHYRDLHRPYRPGRRQGRRTSSQAVSLDSRNLCFDRLVDDQAASRSPAELRFMHHR